MENIANFNFKNRKFLLMVITYFTKTDKNYSNCFFIFVFRIIDNSFLDADWIETIVVDCISVTNYVYKKA